MIFLSVHNDGKFLMSLLTQKLNMESIFISHSYTLSNRIPRTDCNFCRISASICLIFLLQFVCGKRQVASRLCDIYDVLVQQFSLSFALAASGICAT